VNGYRFFFQLARNIAAGNSRNEEIDLRRNKLSYQLREPIVSFFCPAKLDNNVPALNVAEFTKAHSECVYCLCRAYGRRRAKKSDPRGTLPSDCCARAASGHVAAAPPSSVTNSRRFS
jgi:hypothetical protein